MIPHDLYFVGAGWVNEFSGVDSSRLLSYSTILAQVRTRRPEHLKHEEIQILLIKVLLSFHDLLDDVPKKTAVAAITMCTTRPRRRSWTRREMTFGQTLLNGVRSLAHLGTKGTWHEFDIPALPATGVIKKMGRIVKGS